MLLLLYFLLQKKERRGDTYGVKFARESVKVFKRILSFAKTLATFSGGKKQCGKKQLELKGKTKWCFLFLRFCFAFYLISHLVRKIRKSVFVIRIRSFC